jgi:hypothetical protein
MVYCLQGDFFLQKKIVVGAVYEQIGKWFFPKVKGPHGKVVENLSMSDALVDRSDTGANIFTNDSALKEMDFRNPNNLHPWMLNATQADNFPILHAYLTARAEKRKSPTAQDYISRKLYGMSYEKLYQEEYGPGKKPEEMSRLWAVAHHLCGGQGKASIERKGGDPIQMDGDPKYGNGIVARKDFDKNRPRFSKIF